MDCKLSIESIIIGKDTLNFTANDYSVIIGRHRDYDFSKFKTHKYLCI